MPYSHPDSVVHVEYFVRKHAPNAGCVIDVGAGAGSQVRHLRLLVPHARFIGIEKWAPYVDDFELEKLYDEVIIADATWLDWPRLISASDGPSVVIFGDVLEHMSLDSALDLWNFVRGFSDFVIATLPIIDYPQGAVNGNPFETHVTQWTHEHVLDCFSGIEDFYQGEVIGTYLAKGVLNGTDSGYGHHSRAI